MKTKPKKKKVLGWVWTHSTRELIRRFRKWSVLIDFINKIPEDELGETMVMARHEDYWIVGAYYIKGKRLSVKF